MGRNIILISPKLPWPPYDGARVRILETLRFVARRHRVTLLTLMSDADQTGHAGLPDDIYESIEMFSLSSKPNAVCKRIVTGVLRGLPLIQAYYWHPDMARRLRDLTRGSHCDIVHIEFSYLAHYIHAMSPTSRAKTVLSMHNVDTIRFARELRYMPWNSRRLGLMWDYYLYPKWEPKAIRPFDGILATSGLEREWIERHAPAAQVNLLPNGVDVEYFHVSKVVRKRQSLVFIGLMDYAPNIDAMLWFSREIWPQMRQQFPQLTLKIVGRYPPSNILALQEQPGICITGEVPDVRPYIAEALASVVPLRSGGGTRLKILSAMAQGCPVISTRLGAEGLDVTPGENILLAENAEQFIRHLQSLLDDPQRGEQLGQAARRLVVERYTWETCLRGLDTLYDTLLKDAD